MRDFKTYCAHRDAQVVIWEMVCVGADIENLVQEIDAKYPGTLDVAMLQEQLSGRGAGWGALAGGALGTLAGGMTVPGAALGAAAGAAAPWLWNQFKNTYKGYDPRHGSATSTTADKTPPSDVMTRIGNQLKNTTPQQTVQIMRASLEALKKNMVGHDDIGIRNNIDMLSSELEKLESKIKGMVYLPS